MAVYAARTNHIGACLGYNMDYDSEPTKGFCMSLAPVQHIEIDENGIARIAGTRTKVIQVAMDKRFYGWGPEEIQAEHPHLSLADVHAALAFYYDHQAQLDAQIEQDQKDAEALRAAAGESPVARRLKSEGRLP